MNSSEADAAAAVLANAFAEDPIFRYILGDRNDIERRAKHLFVENIAAEMRKSAHLVR